MIMIKLACDGVAHERLSALEDRLNEAVTDRLDSMMYALHADNENLRRRYIDGNFDDALPNHVNCRCTIIPNDANIIDASWEYVKPALVEHIKGKT